MKILLPIDGSPDALNAVRLALQWASSGLRAEYVLVNVQDPASLYEMVVAHDVDRLAALRAEAGAELLQPAEALLDAVGATYESEVAGGTPAPLLLELAENYGCQAVMMGARGMGSPGAGGLGSVALSLLQHSSLPVTIVRNTADDEAAAADDDAPAAD